MWKSGAIFRLFKETSQQGISSLTDSYLEEFHKLPKSSSTREGRKIYGTFQ